MARYTITIPNWTPTSVNKLVGQHWAPGARRKCGDRNLIAVYARHHAFRGRIPEARGRRRVSITATYAGRGRLPDPDNLLKSTLDSLVYAKMLIDDSQQWCEWSRPVVERGQVKRTVITLEDM